MTPVVKICPPMPAHDWEPYDAHAHYRTHRRPSAEAGVDFSDYARGMHTTRIKQRRAGRKPAPWAFCDETLRELLLVFLERRFAVRATPGADADTRLAHIEAAARAAGGREQERLLKFLKAYEHAPRRVGVQLLNIDTQIALTQRGIAQIIAALCYLYFRLGYASTDCAEFLSLKPPHVRQLLARLALTWERYLAPDAPRRGMQGRRSFTPAQRAEESTRMREYWTAERRALQSRRMARLASRTRIRAGVGELYSVRQRLRRVETPLKLGGRTPAERRNG